MNPLNVRAADVKVGDLMNYSHHPRQYDRVVGVHTEGDQTKINWFTAAYEYYTVKHPEEGVTVWREERL